MIADREPERRFWYRAIFARTAHTEGNLLCIDTVPAIAKGTKIALRKNIMKPRAQALSTPRCHGKAPVFQGEAQRGRNRQDGRKKKRKKRIVP